MEPKAWHEATIVNQVPLRKRSFLNKKYNSLSVNLTKQTSTFITANEKQQLFQQQKRDNSPSWQFPNASPSRSGSRVDKSLHLSKLNIPTPFVPNLSEDNKIEKQEILDLGFWNVEDEESHSRKVKTMRIEYEDVALDASGDNNVNVQFNSAHRQNSLIIACNGNKQDSNQIVEQLNSIFNNSNIHDVSLSNSSLAFNITIQLTELIDWIHGVTNEKIGEDLISELKSGVILCKLANAIIPNSVKNIYPSEDAFGVIENIANFIKLCKTSFQLNIIFREEDLVHEQGDKLKVLNSLYELAQLVHLYNPKLPQLKDKPESFVYSKKLLEIAVQYTIRQMCHSLSPRSI